MHLLWLFCNSDNKHGRKEESAARCCHYHDVQLPCLGRVTQRRRENQTCHCRREHFSQFRSTCLTSVYWGICEKGKSLQVWTQHVLLELWNTESSNFAANCFLHLGRSYPQSKILQVRSFFLNTKKWNEFNMLPICQPKAWMYHEVLNTHHKMFWLYNMPCWVTSDTG